ncbi:hypothetical protein LPJ79_004569 [Coemansia sp. RSA 1821]|nr:hypothetical protein LPJ79_004569 [Coemansia sp. RSA 1821]
MSAESFQSAQYDRCFKIKKDEVSDAEDLKRKIMEECDEQSFSLTVDDEQTTPIEEKFVELVQQEGPTAINMNVDS